MSSSHYQAAAARADHKHPVMAMHVPSVPRPAARIKEIDW